MKSKEEIDNLECKINFLKAFCNHSKKGFKCPECEKFIPNSYKGTNCPYTKCRKYIDRSITVEKKHPVIFGRRQYVYINNTINKFNNDKKEFSERYCDTSGNAYDLLSMEEERVKEISMIADIISKQKKANGNTRKIPIKSCMYDAFDTVLKESPDEMVKYLVNGGQNGDISIQAIIFQTFVDIIKSKFPIIVFIKSIQIKIDSLLDGRLNIFDGKRKFINFLDHNLIVKKRCQFRIDNDICVKDQSDHFIGKITSITNSKGDDVSHFIDSYSFSNIKMCNSEFIKPAEDIIVEYYSLKPSYTMGPLIHLQRIKRKISDSIRKKTL